MSGQEVPPLSEDGDGTPDAHTFASLKASGKLPSPGRVALDILHLSQQEYVSNAQITRVILVDRVLAERLIKAANILARGGKRTVIGVEDAVSVLGLPVIVQLALAFSLLSQNRAGSSKRFNYQRFWSRSLLLGTAMQALALRGHLTKTEELFACGLLASIGQLALANAHPNEYDDILDHTSEGDSSARLALEKERLSIDSVRLTTMLLSDWGCPQVITRTTLAINQLKITATGQASRDDQLTQVIHLASALTAAALAEADERQRLLPSLFLSAARSGIDGEDLRMVFDEVVAQWREWGDLLELPIREVLPFVAPLSQAVTGIQAKVTSASSNVDKAIYPLRVLAVDDDPTILSVLKRLLTTAGHTVHTASNGAEALERALEVSPELVITDWVMPNMDGLQFCRALRATKLGKGMYVLLLTSFEEEERLVEAFEAGADDYVNKPFSPRALSARLRAAQRVLQLQEELRRDAEEIHRFATALTVTNRRLQQAAMTDALTDLPNRRYALDRLEQERAAVERRKSVLSCVLIGADNFKRINETFGREAGDAVLRGLAQRLRQGARLQDAVARLGGDQILVICPDTNSLDAFKCAERLRNLVVASPIVVGELSVDLTISLGVATLGTEAKNISVLMAQAGQALQLAKGAGRNRAFIWTDAQGF